MDFLNKAMSQVNELFKGMTPGARMTAGMLLVMIVISLVYLMAFQSSKADRYLFGSQEFTDEDIASMQQAFSAENLDDYELEGRRVRVPRGKLTQYMQAINKAGFSPADIEADLDEIRKYGSSMFESEKEKEFWRSVAQQQKLARAIAKRPEIDWATVQYREVKMDGFPPTTQRKATVIACGANHQPLDPATAKTIRVVASSWFGIRTEDVAVNDVNGITYSDGEDADGLSKEARLYAQAKRQYEDLYRRKIEQCLSIYPGVVATVNVEMDPTISNESTKVVVDPQTTALESDVFSKTSESRPANGGRPGAAPNEVAGANEPRSLQTLANEETLSDETREQQVSVAGHEQTRERKAALVPKFVTATVSIPRSHFQDVWLERGGEEPASDSPADVDRMKNEISTIEAEILEQIKEQVVRTLPPAEVGESSYPHVNVISYDDLSVEPPDPPSLAITALSWLSENWQTIGLFAVGLVSLFVLRGMTRATAPSNTPVAPPMEVDVPQVAEEEIEEEVAAAMLHRRGPSTGTSLREELTTIVREDPDAAANVLRTWIGDAA